MPSSTGMNQQFTQLQPATIMNQQFGQDQPTGTGLNWQFGLLQPPSTGINQQFGQPPSSAIMTHQVFPSQGNQIRLPVSMSTPASHHLWLQVGLMLGKLPVMRHATYVLFGGYQERSESRFGIYQIKIVIACFF